MTTLTYEGDMEGDFWTLTLTAFGSTITFSNAQDVDEPGLTISGLSAGQTVVVDGHGRNVTVNGADGINKVASGSGWPFLYPGDNTLTITGGTGTLTHTPLYV